VLPFTDAYRVEVEVDVGLAKMTDFKVAGLPGMYIDEFAKDVNLLGLRIEHSDNAIVDVDGR
jgi:hypothetical protein